MDSRRSLLSNILVHGYDVIRNEVVWGFSLQVYLDRRGFVASKAGSQGSTKNIDLCSSDRHREAASSAPSRLWRLTESLGFLQLTMRRSR